MSSSGVLSPKIVVVQAQFPKVEEVPTFTHCKNWLYGLLREAVMPKQEGQEVLAVLPEHIGTPWVAVAMNQGGYTEINPQNIRAIAIISWRFFQMALEQASAEFGIWISGCSIRETQGKVYTSNVLMHKGGKWGAYTNKAHLVGLEERLGISPGDEMSCVPTEETPFGVIGVAICLDAFYDDILKELGSRGVQTLLMPSLGITPWDGYEDPAHGSLWQPFAWTKATVSPFAHRTLGRTLQVIANPFATGSWPGMGELTGQSAITIRSNRLRRCPYLGVEGEFAARFHWCAEYPSLGTQVGSIIL